MEQTFKTTTFSSISPPSRNKFSNNGLHTISIDMASLAGRAGFTQYKSKNNKFSQWLIDKARALGLEEKPRTTSTSSPEEPPFQISTLTSSKKKDLAKAIAKIPPPGCVVPVEILYRLDDVISGRKETVTWYRRFALFDSAKAMDCDLSYQFFVDISQRSLRFFTNAAIQTLSPGREKEAKRRSRPQTLLTCLTSIRYTTSSNISTYRSQLNNLQTTNLRLRQVLRNGNMHDRRRSQKLKHFLFTSNSLSCSGFFESSTILGAR